MNNPVIWFEIYVDDMQRAKAFYESVLQIKLEKLADTQFEMWSFPSDMKGFGATGALIRMPGYPVGGQGTLVYFGCDDCAVEAERANKHGGKIEKPKQSIGKYGSIALIVDTEGNMVGLHSM
jgi:uncharacterized protein